MAEMYFAFDGVETGPNCRLTPFFLDYFTQDSTLIISHKSLFFETTFKLKLTFTSYSERIFSFE